VAPKIRTNAAPKWRWRRTNEKCRSRFNRSKIQR
jgi:hypothetical protein